MKAVSRVLAAASSLSLALCITDPAIAQTSGGILKISHFGSPGSMSLLEESTAAALRPIMGVFVHQSNPGRVSHFEWHDIRSKA